MMASTGNPILRRRTLVILGLGVVLVLAGRMLGLYRAFRIPTGAMLPTLEVGDYFYAWRVADPSTVRQGEIIVFKYPQDQRVDYIKRCVAVAGDTVAVRAGLLYVNGRIYESNLAEPGGDHSCIPGSGPCPQPFTLHDEASYARNPRNASWPWEGSGVPDPYVVPAGHVFTVGDNRYNSMDSRYWGPLPFELITYRAGVIYWSWDAERSRPRLARIGDRVR